MRATGRPRAHSLQLTTPLCACLPACLQAREPAPLPPRLLEVLQVAGQYLYHDPATLTRLVRVLGAAAAAHAAAGAAAGAHALAGTAEMHAVQVREVLAHNVLPAMSLLPANTALVFEVWAALRHLPYPQRFSLYADLREAAAASPLLTASARLAETEVKRILRRVTAPANKVRGARGEADGQS